MFRLGRLPERLDQVCDEHLTILDALASGDGEAARAGRCKLISTTFAPTCCSA